MNHYIERHILEVLRNIYRNTDDPQGVILPGIVGSGKTFVINKLCHILKEDFGYDILKYDGDDVSFRRRVSQDSKIFIHEILEKKLKRPFIFVDEVQKEPSIFDAIKMSYDKTNASFIVSGSNPAYLNTNAKDRLQRRADLITMLPLSLSEILKHKGIIKNFNIQNFLNILFKHDADALSQIPLDGGETQYEEIKVITKEYLLYGGLPKVYLSHHAQNKFREIKLVAERGISESYVKHALDDEVRIYLSLQNSKEFTYKGIGQQIRDAKRETVNQVIDHLINHGYLLKKRPYLCEFEYEKSTYFSCYSWIDSGIASYYKGATNLPDTEMGFHLEAYVHSILRFYMENFQLKSQLYYYKPFKYKSVNDSLDFMEGEIDFIIKTGKRIIPVEVKLTQKIKDIDTSLICSAVGKWNSPYGVVIYGGAPFLDRERSLLFYPYWLI